MKKILLFVITIIFASASIAQDKRLIHPPVIQGIPAVEMDIPVINPHQLSNPSVNSKALLEDDLGTTRYDLQTNYAIQNRIKLFPDGTIAGTWTRGITETAFSERGTGYNYFDGTTWGPEPTSRIETVRTGWPSVDAWNASGEIVVSHQSAILPIVKNTRALKGTGNWTQVLIPKPVGCAGIFWPRMITNGPDNSYVHIITCSGPTANGGSPYLGMDPAFLYYRSLDGGATWDKLGIQFPGLNSSYYNGFSADTYAWGDPKGDTIYFAVGGAYSDTFIMKSTDNGETWTKIPILSNVNKKIPDGTTYLPPWKSTDGAVACEMDQNGVIHFASGIGGGFVDGGSNYITINYNGLIYWNTTMPMLQDSLDLDTLDAHGQLLGYYSDGPNPGDTLNTVTGYRVALTSFPQISVDAANNLYVIYSGVTWENPSPEGINYRHIFGRAKFRDKATWSSEPIDLNADLIYNGNEFIFASMAKRITGNKLHIIYQTANEPGTAVGTSGTSGAIPYHDNTIQYREIPISTFGNPPVNNPTLTISTLQNVAAGPVSVPIHATNFNNLGAFQFTLEYNPALMTYTGCSNWYPGITDVLIGTGTPGKITFIWAASSQGVNLPDGNFFNLNFTWLGSSGTSPISWNDSPTPREFSDYNGLIFAPTYTNGGVTGTQPATHFIPVWTGNPLNPMAIGVTQARLDLVDLAAGDEIGVFDGNYCVGVYKLTAPINPNNPPFITVSKDDPEIAGINGYTEGNTIIYKLWKNSTSSEISSVTHTFPYAPLFVFETYTQNETAVVALAGYTTITQDIVLLAGWNMISFDVLPSDMNLLTILQPLVTSANLIKVIDEAGNIIQNFPWGWVNNIGNMAITEGYYIKVAAPCTLSVTAAPALSPNIIPLISGWNMMGYPCQNQQNALTALQPLITAGTLVKVIDEAGNIIQNFPWGWVNNIGNFKAGEGYYIKVNAACSLTLTNPLVKNAGEGIVTLQRPAHFILPGQGNPYRPMALGISVNPDLFNTLNNGDEIGVFDGDICTGALVIEKQGSSHPVFTAYADDPSTIGIDGFTEGNPISFRYWNKTTNLETAIGVIYTNGDPLFTRLGTYIGELANTLTGLSSTAKSLTYLGNNRPNPFNGVTEIEYQLADQAHVLLKVFTPNGIQITELVNSLQEKGRHTVKFNAQSLPPGVYYYQLLATFGSEQYTETKKMIIVR